MDLHAVFDIILSTWIAHNINFLKEYTKEVYLICERQKAREMDSSCTEL